MRVTHSDMECHESRHGLLTQQYPSKFPEVVANIRETLIFKYLCRASSFPLMLDKIAQSNTNQIRITVEYLISRLMHIHARESGAAAV